MTRCATGGCRARLEETASLLPKADDMQKHIDSEKERVRKHFKVVMPTLGCRVLTDNIELSQELMDKIATVIASE